MRALSHETLVQDIEKYWEEFFAKEIAEAESECQRRREDADIARQRLERDQQKKDDLEQQIRWKVGEQTRCQQRRRTHSERVQENMRQLADTERQVEDALLRVNRAEDEVTYTRRRCTDLESSAPIETSNYEAELEAYNEYISILDNKIEELEAQLKRVEKSADDGPSKSADVQRLTHLIEEVQLKRDLEKRPREDRAFLEQRERFEKTLADARNDYAAACTARDQAKSELDDVRSDLDYYQDQAGELASEPERDAEVEKRAEEDELELRALLDSIQLTLTSEEQQLLRAEEAAMRHLQTVKATVGERVKSSVARLDQSAMSRNGHLSELETLTGERELARGLWDRAVQQEEARILLEVSPNLPSLREDLESAERELKAVRTNITNQFDNFELSSDEERILTETFTPDQEDVLDHGGELTYYLETSITEKLLYAFTAVVLILGAPIVLKNVYAPDSDWVWAGRLSIIFGVVLGFIGTLSLIAFRESKRPIQTVSRSASKDGFTRFRDSGGKYKPYKLALKHRELKLRYDELETHTSRLRQSYGAAQQRGNEKLAEWLPADALGYPILSDEELAPVVDDLRGRIVAASVDPGQWPVADLRPMQARYKPNVKGYDDVWDTWSAMLEQERLTAFLPGVNS